MAAVEKLFWKEPYLEQIQALVTTVTGNVITLDRTIFFAFSGGQASDAGMIHGCKVLSAEKVEQEIFYTLEDGHGLRPMDCVQVMIDWNRRYKIMRLHFAAEIVLELVYQNYNHPPKIGANITEEKARIDFFWQGNIAEAFPLLEEKTQQLIAANLAIESGFSDEAQGLRYWQIPGFAKVPCGGTHLRATGEIGDLILKRGKRLGSNKERIEIYLKNP
jgi:Ser-tRNA(Ala) deacylase AlaX